MQLRKRLIQQPRHNNIYALQILNVGLMLLGSMFLGTRLFIPFTDQILGSIFSAGRSISLIRRKNESFKTEFCKLHSEDTLNFCEEIMVNLFQKTFLSYLPSQLSPYSILKIVRSSERKLFKAVYTYSITRNKFRRKSLLVSALIFTLMFYQWLPRTTFKA